MIGTPLGGCVIPQVYAALVPLDVEFRNTLRHELAHLFAARLGPLSPPLKSEGLAVWIQCNGRTPLLEESTMRALSEGGNLPALLQSASFIDVKARTASYQIAGSFTDFLIRRFGWPTYRCFFKQAHARNFFRIFERAFSLTIERAESLWLEGVRAQV